MARPKCCRRVAALPACAVYKPSGVPARKLEEVALAVDEFEALRLADYEGLYQEEAARRMKVSRQTFGRIVEAARKKVARVLVEGLALRIEGGEIEMAATRAFQCADCGHVWEVPFGTGRPAQCPACQGENFHRAEEAGAGRGACRRRGCGPVGRGAAQGQGMRRGRGAGRERPEGPAGGDTGTTEQQEDAQ